MAGYFEVEMHDVSLLLVGSDGITYFRRYEDVTMEQAMSFAISDVEDMHDIMVVEVKADATWSELTFI